LALSAGTKLGRYEIRSPLGAGGMGEVYLAQDTKLDRRVALKILPADVAAHLDRMKRFVQEAKAASALNHPNIITIHEIDETDSGHFIATEFIDGETMRDHMRSTPMKFAEVLDVAAQIANALSAAHAAGIVHRDIKPDNIMLRRDGIVKVLDFGLAKLAEQEGTGPEDKTRELVKTSTGVVMGTVPYMSPEQARGLAVDARTDIWSLGVVLYEMLAGRVPFEGPSTSDILVSILEREPRLLTSAGRNIPETLEFIVIKALTKDREDRYQTAREMLADLRWLKARLAAGELEHSIADVTSVAGQNISAQTREPVHVSPSIAVLPFVNMSADTENEYFCDGLAEDLINALTKVENLYVVARTSAFSFKGKEMDVREIGGRLNVANVLEGSVRKAGNRLRITAQLISVEDGYHLWSERYDRELEDVFAIQDEITLAIVDKLKVKLLKGERAALLDRYRDNLEAYNLYLKGLHYWSQRPLGIRRAIEYFEQAIEKDSNYALAYVGLADCYNALGSWENGTMAPAEAMPKGKAAAERALALDSMLAEAHTSLAYGVMHYDWDWRRADARYRHAFDINPNYPTAHHWRSHYLTAMGRAEDSLAESKRFLELDPLDLLANVHLSWHYIFARQYDEAIEQCWKSNDLFPNSFWPSFFFALAYEQKGMLDEASGEFEKAIKMSGNITFAKAGLGHLYAASGEKARAENIIAELDEISKTRYVSSYDVAVIHAGLGERDLAFKWLDRAYQEHSSWLAYLKVEPRLDALRSDSRFGDLLRSVGLVP
jgi:serine/threonine protein kinase/tetratricopeptide (TPR) repeat protein